jgi:hypothetical protein
MRYVQLLSSALWLIAGATAAFADQPPLDCSKKSLASAVAGAAAGDAITFTGLCAGPVVVRTDRLTLTGVGWAIIDGGGKDALTIAGASGASLANFEVLNGLNGILGVNGAHITLTGVNVHDNTLFGISLQTSSSAVLSDVTTARNGLHGLDLQTGSAATIRGTFTSSRNQVFGINANGSSLTFSAATATVSGNALGIQVATGANAFLNDSKTVINLNDNLAVGLTVVSGAHMASFGGTISASGNPINGVSVNSKGGLDLDAGSQLNVFNNGDGVVLQEASVMTVFNTPQFSGAPGFSTVNSYDNREIGVRVQTGSTLTLSNQAKVIEHADFRYLFLRCDCVGAGLVWS